MFDAELKRSYQENQRHQVGSSFYYMFIRRKTGETPPKFGITQDECANMIYDQVNFFEISMHDNLSKFMGSFGKKEKKKPKILGFPHNVSTSGAAPVASQP